jgi:hypothetical protein
MRHAPRALLAGGLGFAVSFLVACGGGAGLLSGGQSSTLNAALDKVSSAVSARDCGAAASAAASLTNAVAGLPPTVNDTLTSNLDQGASTIAQLATKDCGTTTRTTTKPPPTTTTTSTTTTSTTTSSSTTSSTSTTPTIPTTTVTTTTPATTTTPPGTTSTGTSGGAGVGGAGGGGSGGAGSGNGNSQ